MSKHGHPKHADAGGAATSVQTVRLAELARPAVSVSAVQEPTQTGLLGRYVSHWWTEHSRIVAALADDIILYACFYLFAIAMHLLIQFAGAYAGPDMHLHQELHHHALLVADGVIILGFIRKLLTVVWFH